MLRPVRVILLATLILGSLTGLARAGTPTWVPVTGPAAGAYGLGAVAVAPDNSAVAAWYEDVFTPTPAVKILSLAPGPSAPDSQTVNPSIITSTAVAPPAVAIAPTHDALVAWTNDTAVGYTLRQAPGTTFAPTQTLTVPGNTAHNAVYPNVVATSDANGDFLVAYDNHVDGNYRLPPSANNLDSLVVWQVSGATGLPSGPTTVDTSESPGSTAYFSDLSMSEAPDGSVLLSYTRQGQVRYVHRSGAGVWSSAQSVTGAAGSSVSALGPTGPACWRGSGAPTPSASATRPTAR